LSFQIREEGATVAPRPLGPTLNTNAIVDIVSLPDGIHALHQDKKRYMIATLVLLRQLRPWITKVEFKYIERYVKIEKPVATTTRYILLCQEP
jgi:hypothetical protein